MGQKGTYIWLQLRELCLLLPKFIFMLEYCFFVMTWAPFSEQILHVRENEQLIHHFGSTEQTSLTWGTKSTCIVTSVLQTLESAPSLNMKGGSENRETWPGLFCVFQYELYTGFIISQRKGQNTLLNLNDWWRVFSEGLHKQLVSFENDQSDLTFEWGFSSQGFACSSSPLFFVCSSSPLFFLHDPNFFRKRLYSSGWYMQNIATCSQFH